MDYRIEKATKNDIPRLIDYKLKTIFEYAKELSMEEIDNIHDYVKRHVPIQLENYKIIYHNSDKIGCLLVESKDDGVLLNEIYLEESYRDKGIGTDIIRTVILKNNTVYLFVYKSNVRAVSLYLKLGFRMIEETETRYYMKHSNSERDYTESYHNLHKLQ